MKSHQSTISLHLLDMFSIIFKKYLPACLALLLPAGGIFAQKTLSLEEAVATALQNNYQIQLSKNDSLVAALDYGYRNAVFLPTLNGLLGTTWNNNNQRQTLADGSERESSGIRSNNLQGSVALNWVLFDGFKMFATRDKAEELLRAGSFIIKEEVVNTVADVVTTYYNIARQQQLIKATEVQIELNEERVKLAQNKLDIGTGNKPDVLQSKVDLNAQKALKMQQETFVSQLKDQLVQVMNSNIDAAAFEVPDTIPVNDQLALGDIRANLESTNPSLLLSRSQIEIAGHTLRESKADLLPTLSFNSAYNFNRTNNQKVVNPFSPLFNQASGFNYGFTVNVPIFDRFATRRQIKQNELNLSFQKLNYQNQVSLLNLSILNAYKNYEQQKRALKLEEENIQLAQENVDIVFQTYRLGMATLIQLREAQLSLAQAFDRLIAARYNTKLAETELMRLKGDILK